MRRRARTLLRKEVYVLVEMVVLKFWDQAPGLYRFSFERTSFPPRGGCECFSNVTFASIDLEEWMSQIDVCR